MSPRAATHPLPPVSPEAPDAPGLPRKHREPLATPSPRVRKRGARTGMQATTFQLARWALELNDTALAVMTPTRVVLANPRWHALGRARGPWRREGEAGRWMALRDVGLEEAAAVRAQAAEGPRVTRYRQEGDVRPRLLEVRAERVAGPARGQVLIQMRDITAQVRAEEGLASARAALREREQLRALGELAAGIAHDLRNTLNAMRMRLEMFQAEAAPSPSGRHHLEAMERIVSDASARVDRLRDFSRPKTGSVLERIQLADVVRDAVDIARSGLEHRPRKGGKALRLDVETQERLPEVSGSAMELRYVIINLLINAREAMPRGGLLRVRAFKAGRSVRITVEDEGLGIPEESLPHLFTSFFTTKGDKGTGLGLAMAHGVVTRAGGRLTAANRPQGGAVMTLSFPALKPPGHLKAS